MSAFDPPEILEEGMVIALATYRRTKDGWSAARIDEELVVIATGCGVITKFPSEKMLAAGKGSYSAGGGLSELGEYQSNLNTTAGRQVKVSADSFVACCFHDVLRHEGRAPIASSMRLRPNSNRSSRVSAASGSTPSRPLRTRRASRPAACWRSTAR
jgi:hypothetical protein